MSATTANEITSAEFKTAYTAISQDMLQEANTDGTVKNGIFNYLADKLKTEFDSGGYSNEQKAIAVGQFYSNAYAAMESQAVNATLHILDTDITKGLTAAKVDSEKANQAVAAAQASLIFRERDGFDDNLRVKEAEFNGQVAAFAVNANSGNMQEVVTRFNNAIDAVTPTVHTSTSESGGTTTVTTTFDTITRTYPTST